MGTDSDMLLLMSGVKNWILSYRLRERAQAAFLISVIPLGFRDWLRHVTGFATCGIGSLAITYVHDGT